MGNRTTGSVLGNFGQLVPGGGEFSGASAEFDMPVLAQPFGGPVNLGVHPGIDRIDGPHQAPGLSPVGLIEQIPLHPVLGDKAEQDHATLFELIIFAIEFFDTRYRRPDKLGRVTGRRLEGKSMGIEIFVFDKSAGGDKDGL